METHHLGIVHPVQVVAAENQDLVRFVIHGVIQRGADGVAGALEPVAFIRSLFRGEDVHESVGEHVESVSLHDVPVQAGGQELGQDEDLLDPRIDAVADGDVDQPVFAGDGYGWFGAVAGERVEA